MTSDAWVNDVRAKLKAIKGPGPETVCLVYITEGLHHPAIGYTEVYGDETIAVKSLLARGFLPVGAASPDMYYTDFCRAVIRANVGVKTDADSL